MDAIKREIWNFLQNFSFISCANSEVQSENFNTVEVVQYAILRIPSNGFLPINAQMIGLTDRNNWNFFQDFSLIPFSRNVAGSEKEGIPYI